MRGCRNLQKVPAPYLRTHTVCSFPREYCLSEKLLTGCLSEEGRLLGVAAWPAVLAGRPLGHLGELQDSVTGVAKLQGLESKPDKL